MLADIATRAAEGFFVAGLANHRSAGQSVIAYREVGATRTFAARARQLYDADVVGTVPGWAAEGFLVSALANHRSAGQLVVAER